LMIVSKLLLGITLKPMLSLLLFARVQLVVKMPMPPELTT